MLCHINLDIDGLPCLVCFCFCNYTIKKLKSVSLFLALHDIRASSGIGLCGVMSFSVISIYYEMIRYIYKLSGV